MKKIVLSSLLLIAVIRLNAQIPTDSLVGYWPFNGNANDLSGNGNNGTVYNATLTTDRFGNLNSAYLFNGSTDYIEVLPSASLNTTMMSSFSISFWSKLNSLSDHNFFVTVSNKSDDINYSFRIENNGGMADTSTIYLQNNGGNCNLIDKRKADTAKWYHIAVTLDYNSNTGKLYINDTLVNSNVNTIAKPDNPFYTFGKHTQQDWFLNGVLDDIRVYKKVLNSNEIHSLFYELKCTETVYDTIKVTKYDTVRTNIFDTIKINQTVYDTVKVTVQDTLKIDVSITGVNPPNNICDIKVYPNPTKDKIFIDLSDYSLMNNFKLKIIDLKSNIIWQTTVSSSSYDIDISSFGKSGLYFLQIIDSNSIVVDTKKIVLY